MQVKLIPDKGMPHAPWQPDEVVSVQVRSVEPDGSYICETVETYPLDIKEQHALALTRLQDAHEEATGFLRDAHAREIAVIMAGRPELPES